ncbi:carbohydrate-binding module family 13 protein [Trichoderma citrinoviride]|uniref:Carbohydrate-binding module family 13 protein n=1 Tax=Trichoderma citrinoviride TaxID=58853 RepID=A0A2T4B0D5_9HYPO|nr:carbohydrate-binding module family 13 protein [Trichoderma citrinoviride]PTB62698.1 carbohydrate-binding module family 13 protein [Trichoderma citrinoviride]
MSFNEGTYYIATALSNHKAIDLDSSEATGRIIEYEGHGGKNQQWRITKITHEEFSIQSVATNTFITAPNGGDATAHGSKLLPECNNVARWKIVKASKSDNYHIYSVAFPNKVLDVTGSKQDNSTPIIVYNYHGGVNQQFTFKEV